MDTETVLVKSEHPESQGEFVRINKSDFVEGKHELHVLAPPVAAVPVVPPPPPVVDPLASLVGDWKAKPADVLMKLAEKVAGRTPADGTEAIAMLDAALAAKAAPPQ